MSSITYIEYPYITIINHEFLILDQKFFRPRPRQFTILATVPYGFP